MSKGYIKSLDGLRAVAVILVMSFHDDLNRFGWIGVQLFFVLSGFLITGILVKEKSTEAPIISKLKKFWVRRSLRIFPLYYLYLVVIALLFLVFSFPYYFPIYIPYLATYTFNYTRSFEGWFGNPLFTHLWSLSIEEQFYLFFPLLVFILPVRVLKWFMGLVILLSPLIRFLIFRYFHSGGHDAEAAADIVYWNTLCHLDAFFLGGLIPVLGWRVRQSRAVMISFILLAVACVVGYWSYSSGTQSFPYINDLGYGHGNTAHFEYVWTYSLLNLFFASLIIVLAASEGKGTWFARLMESSLLVNIGRVSYGMYLFHWAILVYGFNHLLPLQADIPKLVVFPVYVAAVYGAAWISFRIFESKFIQLKDKFFPSKGAIVQSRATN